MADLAVCPRALLTNFLARSTRRPFAWQPPSQCAPSLRRHQAHAILSRKNNQFAPCFALHSGGGGTFGGIGGGWGGNGGPDRSGDNEGGDQGGFPGAVLLVWLAAAAALALPEEARAAALGLLAGDNTRCKFTGRTAREFMEAYKEECRIRHYEFYDEPWKLNLIGVRNPSKEAGLFDDQFSVLYNKGDGEWEVVTYTATTDPGQAWLKVNFTAKGTAILCPRQYVDTWEIGPHKGYEALIQCKPIKIWRDSNRDGRIDTGVWGSHDEEGFFGINIHHGGIRDAQQYHQQSRVFKDMVEKYSAGCQVIATEDDFKHFMSLVRKSKAMGHGSRFTYTLFQGAGVWENLSSPLREAVIDHKDAEGSLVLANRSRR